LLADTHCHLDFEAFDTDREAVIARARAAGVEKILNPGIDISSSRSAVELSRSYREVFAAVGVHPNEALTWDANSAKELQAMATQGRVAAIGEIGLDYYRQRAPAALQKEVFKQQLSLAAELGLPVIIHTRNANADEPAAMADVLDILSDWKLTLTARGLELAQRPGVLHSFSGDEEQAQRAAELNFWIGITGPVTFRNAPGLQRVVASLQVERLLVETDAPFLTPHPHRGKRNEPAYVRFIVEKIAQIHGLVFDEVSEITASNAGRLFNWRVTN
jgi:TatD DNase family protein